MTAVKTPQENRKHLEHFLAKCVLTCISTKWNYRQKQEDKIIKRYSGVKPFGLAELMEGNGNQ